MIFYVSSNGCGNGTSENSPFGLSELKNITLNDGDIVLFKNGDVFYEVVEYKKNKHSRVIFDAYGVGDKQPTFSCCRVVVSGSSWIKESQNIYKIDLSDSSNYSGTRDVTEANNVGFMICDGDVLYCDRKESKNNLSKPFDYYCDDEFIYVYSVANPNLLYNEIRFICNPKNNTAFQVQSNVTIQNLHFEYIGGHAVKGYDNPENVIIQNNNFNFIGGCRLTSNSSYIRYGNAIEFFNYGKNIIVRNNHISNCYDVGFTLQGNDGYWENVSVYDNTFKTNSQSFELWGRNVNGGDDTGFKNIRFYNNICIDQGRGWGYIRVDKHKSADIEIQYMELKSNDISIENNIFYNPIRLSYVRNDSSNVYLTQIKQNNNKIYLNSESTIYNDEFDIYSKNEFITLYNKETDSKFMIVDSDNIYDNIYEKISSTIDESNIRRHNRPNSMSVMNNDTIIYNTPDILNDDYILISECVLEDNYVRKELIFFYSLIDDSIHFEDMGLVKVRISTNDKKEPTIHFSSSNEAYNRFIDNRNFELYYKTDNVGVTNIKIYYKIAKNYAKLMVKKIFARGMELNYGLLSKPADGYTKKVSDNIAGNTFDVGGNNTTMGYVKICEVVMSSRYDYGIFKLTAMDVMSSNFCQCELFIKVRQELDITENPQVTLLCVNNLEDDSAENTVLTYKNFFGKIINGDQNKVEVYYKFDKQYCRSQFKEDQRFVIGGCKFSLMKTHQPIEPSISGNIIGCSKE